MNLPASVPSPGFASPTTASQTMDLRDTFAAHLVAALIVAPKVPGVLRPEMDALAKMAYAYADAMLRAR